MYFGSEVVGEGGGRGDGCWGLGLEGGSRERCRVRGNTFTAYINAHGDISSNGAAA